MNPIHLEPIGSHYLKAYTEDVKVVGLTDRGTIHIPVHEGEIIISKIAEVHILRNWTMI